MSLGSPRPLPRSLTRRQRRFRRVMGDLLSAGLLLLILSALALAWTGDCGSGSVFLP